MKSAFSSIAVCFHWLYQNQIAKIATIISLIILLFSKAIVAQQNNSNRKPDHIEVSFSNSHTTMPYGSFSKLFYKEIHPGIEIGTGFNWTSKPKHDWFQTFKLGYSYYQFVQRTLMLYSEFGYRYKFPLGISVSASLGGGWMHSRQDAEVFALQNDGEYVNAKKGRSHGMATFSIGASKQITKSGMQLFMNYQQRFQFAFIDAYVPALPVNSLSFGIQIPLHKN